MSMLPRNRVARQTLLGTMADKIVGFDWRWVGLIGVGLVAVSTLMIFLKSKKAEKNGETQS